ncbi:hypothetical protein J4732_22385 [Serratia marcescens]|uniref:Uncharacterized protein n=1 Tax=Serratia marcescens TaxID=615 RepID=A0A939NN10_SERMA|nr:hypothetical protein [Serratia marcescens]
MSAFCSGQSHNLCGVKTGGEKPGRKDIPGNALQPIIERRRCCPCWRSCC